MRAKLILGIAATLALAASGCATKKFVQQQVSMSEDKLGKQMEDQARKQEQRDAEQSAKLEELANLNRSNAARIEEVSREATAGIAEARRVGSEAQQAASQALQRTESLEQEVANIGNYQVLETTDILFGFDSATLDSEDKEALDAIASKLASDRKLIVELVGYTDSVGDREYNILLSEKRVDNVLRYLIENGNVEVYRINRVGLGEANPAADNRTRAGRAQNRRVTVRILGMKG